MEILLSFASVSGAFPGARRHVHSSAPLHSFIELVVLVVTVITQQKNSCYIDLCIIVLSSTPPPPLGSICNRSRLLAHCSGLIKPKQNLISPNQEIEVARLWKSSGFLFHGPGGEGGVGLG